MVLLWITTVICKQIETATMFYLEIFKVLNESQLLCRAMTYSYKQHSYIV